MKGKTQVIYFSRRFVAPEGIPFVNNVSYLGVTFDRRITWRLHIERTGAKALVTYIIPSLFKDPVVQYKYSKTWL
jgi:hypothetical protein